MEQFRNLAQKINQSSIIVFRVDVIEPNQTPVCYYFKAKLRKTIKPTKNPTLLFLWKMYYEVKSKMGSTLVQLTVIFLNETKRTPTKLE